MKRATSVILALLMSLSLCMPAMAANADNNAKDYVMTALVDGQDHVTVTKGDTVRVSLVLSSVDGGTFTLYSMQDWVMFDPDYLRLEEDSVKVYSVEDVDIVDWWARPFDSSNTEYDNSVFPHCSRLDDEDGVELPSGAVIISFDLRAVDTTDSTAITHRLPEIYKETDPKLAYKVTPVNATVTIVNRSYTVTLYDEDGTTVYKTLDMPEGESVKLPNGSAKDGYTFKGWKDQDGKIWPENTYYTGDGNASLTAVYEETKYKVTYVIAGNETVTIDNIKGSYSLMEHTPREGYQFNGWTLNGVTYQDGDIYNVTEDVTFVADWTWISPEPEPEQCTVTYESAGVNTVRTYNKGDTVTLMTPDGKSGYTFGGWRLKGTTTTYSAGDSYVLNANATFEAIWNYTGTGGGGGGGSSSSTTTTVDPSLPAEDASIAGPADRLEALRDATECDLTEASCPAYPYEDLDISEWYHTGIHYCLEMGRMVGVEENVFAPFNTLTRGMLVTILYQMDSKPDAAGSSTFEDVADGVWYSDAIAWAEQNNIVAGYSDTEFAPDQVITREQMAAIMYRYAQYKSYDLSITNDLSAYDDANTVSDWAVTAVEWAVSHGLISGRTATTLVPQGETTRAEAATIIYSFDLNIA